ncbi:MAG: hypothetical protein LQ340_005799, partial [Diploschistes diacapsis]
MPSTHHLVVTTTKGVYTWNAHGIAVLFTSPSVGIVAAKKIQGTKDLLAVADSQLVILHDYYEGNQRIYRLRREDQGQVCMLYFDKDSERLFFTTTMQNAVQSYSLRSECLLDPAPAHPSPPNVFAVSPTFDILLSSSAKPPTIYLTNIILNRLPMQLQPDCSTSAVVAACFHPHRGNIFALGFADGTIAAFNAAIFREGDQRSGSRTLHPGDRGEIAHITHLHAPVSSFASPSLSTLMSSTRSSYGSSNTSLGFNDGQSGIRAIAFVPCLTCITASVGAEGRCCIVQFQRRSGFHGTSHLIRSWNVDGPATSLSMVRSATSLEAAQLDGPTADSKWCLATQGLILAIGRDDGRVLLYDIDGNLLAIRDFSDNGRVLDLEWLDGPGDKPVTIAPQRDGAASPARPMDSQSDLQQIPSLDAQNGRASTPPKIRVKLHVKNQPSNGEFVTPKFEKRQSEAQAASSGSPIKNVSSSRKSSNAKQRSPRKLRTFSIRTPRRSPGASVASHSSNSSSKEKSSLLGAGPSRTPTIPPRPVPRPGGKLALHRQETSESRITAEQQRGQLGVQETPPQSSAGGLNIPINLKFLGLSANQPPRSRLLSTYGPVQDVARLSQRSLSPDIIREEISRDMNALTGSELKPVPPAADRNLVRPSGMQVGKSDPTPIQYSPGPLAAVPRSDVQNQYAEASAKEDEVPLERTAVNKAIGIASPPVQPANTEPLQRIASQAGQPQNISPLQRRPSLKPSHAYVSKQPASSRKSIPPPGRHSHTSQSSTSTGTLVDWHSPAPVHRIKHLLNQGQKELSRVSEATTAEPPPKKDSGTSAGTIVDWQLQHHATLARPPPLEREAAKFEPTPSVTANPFVPSRPPQPPGPPSPMPSPKSKWRPTAAGAGFPLLMKREDPMTVAMTPNPQALNAAQNTFQQATVPAPLRTAPPIPQAAELPRAPLSAIPSSTTLPTQPPSPVAVFPSLAAANGVCGPSGVPVTMQPDTGLLLQYRPSALHGDT